MRVDLNHISAKLSFDDYPREEIQYTYTGCKYCKISDKQINDELDNHACFCEYRLKKEAALIVGADEDDLIVKLHKIFNENNSSIAYQKASILFAAIAINSDYLNLAKCFLEIYNKQIQGT